MAGLPKPLLDLVGGRIPLQGRKVIVLVSVDGSGHPRPCLLSPYQVVANPASGEIFVCVHGGSQTARNLAERGVATLIFFAPPAAFYVQGRVSPAGVGGGQSYFKVEPTAIKEDRSQAAPITAGPEYDDRAVKAEYLQVFLGLSRLLEASPSASESASSAGSPPAL